MAEDDVKGSAALARLRLDAPLCDVARPNVDEWAVRRVWEGVQRRRALPAKSERRHVVALAMFAALASVLALVIAGTQLIASPQPQRSEQKSQHEPPIKHEAIPLAAGAASTSAAEPLLTRDARRFEVLEAPPAPSGAAARPRSSASVSSAGSAARIDFADGSSIEATPGTRVEALASSPDEFAVLVRRGRAQFRVTPGGPRRWRIEASHARVEVLGTVLWVASDAAGSSVRVDVGRVLVRSPELPGGSQRVEAGETLRLGHPPAELERPSAPSPEQSPSAAPPPSPRASRPARSRDGRGTAAALWEDADAARRDGQPARAAALLARLIERYPDDSQVALAAFTLGVLQLDRLARPVEAAESFQLALELGIGAALRDDAYLRGAEALSQMGDRARLAMASAEYTRLYPHGRQRAAIDRLARSAANSSAATPGSAAKQPPPNGGASAPSSDAP